MTGVRAYRNVLPGPSFWALRRALVAYVAWCVLGGLVLVGLIVIANQPNSNSLADIFHALLWVWLAGVLVGAVIVALVSAKGRQEVAAGYTTSPFGYQEVDLIDPKTGVVLRRAGEPLFDRVAYRAAVQSSRDDLGPARPSKN